MRFIKVVIVLFILTLPTLGKCEKRSQPQESSESFVSIGFYAYHNPSLLSSFIYNILTTPVDLSENISHNSSGKKSYLRLFLYTTSDKTKTFPESGIRLKPDIPNIGRTQTKGYYLYTLHKIII